ncbi:MAG TPA: DUF433 domain-containing protein [Accumulibacter sp.]|nr:DUF433 domain-containing protein [Accumulibacter sp.]
MPSLSFRPNAESLSRAREDAAAETLVTEDPEVMGGMPCFAGTRVPISIVLASVDDGMSLEEVRESYPYVTEAHVGAARVYAAARPQPSRARRLREVSSRSLLRETVIRRLGGAA